MVSRKILAEDLSPEYALSLIKRVDSNYEIIKEIVDGLLEPYIGDINAIMHECSFLASRDFKSTDLAQLDKVILQIPPIINNAIEGIKELSSKYNYISAIKKELYNSTMISSDGRVADKEAEANMACQQESIVQSAYETSLKALRDKIENLKEMLYSAKKVLNSLEMEFRVSNSNY